MNDIIEIEEYVVMETPMDEVMVTMHYGQTMDLDEVALSYYDDDEGWYTPSHR